MMTTVPAGAHVEYKYTMGDGFWNSEFNSEGRYFTRQLIVPAQNITINDGIQSWQSGPNSPILFEVTVPPEIAEKARVPIERMISIG